MGVLQVREFEPAEYMAYLRAKARPAMPVVPIERVTKQPAPVPAQPEAVTVTSYVSPQHSRAVPFSKSPSVLIRALRHEFYTCNPALANLAHARLLVAETALKHKIQSTDIYGKCRQRHICQARQEAMVKVSRNIPWSLPRIGRFFDRDHTTVLHALRRLSRSRDRGPAVRAYQQQRAALIPEETVQAMIHDYTAGRVSQAEIGRLYNIPECRVGALFSIRGVKKNRERFPRPPVTQLSGSVVREIKAYMANGWGNGQIRAAIGGIVGVKHLHSIRTGKAWRHIPFPGQTTEVAA